MKKYEELYKIREAISILEERKIELESLIRESNNVSVKVITRSTLEKTEELLEIYRILLKKEEKLLL